MSEIADLIQELGGGRNKDELKLIQCTVNSVDLENRICNVNTVSGSTNYDFDAQLCAGIDDGIIIKPAIDSLVYVLIPKYSTPFIVQYSDVVSLLFKGGNFGGLVKVQELTDKINALENKLNDLISACKSQIVTLAPSGAFPLSSFFTSVNNLTPTEREEIENKTITHGDS
jgi:hypothetical protein